MKSPVVRLTTLFLLLSAIVLVLFPIPVRAQAAASLRGPSSVRAGDTVSLTFAVNAAGTEGLTCDIEYNEVQLDNLRIEQSIAYPWEVATQVNHILAYDTTAERSPLQDECAIFTLSFRVKGTLEPGAKLTVTVRNIILSNGKSEHHPDDAMWSAVIGQPRSNDASLSELSAQNATFSPAFSPSHTAYSATVPYSVQSLDLSIVPSHAAAGFKIIGNRLAVGKNTVQIRVTAEDGSQRTYTLTVTRQQDPDYTPDSNASLSALIPNAGILSPAFSANVTEYVLYLPYEAEQLVLYGVPQSETATASELTQSLKIGQNILRFPVTAEDGSTRTYTVYAVRMPQYHAPSDVVLPALTETDTTPATTAPETPPLTESDSEPQSSIPHTTAPPPSSSTAAGASPSEKNTSLSLLLVLPVALVAFSVGFFLARRIEKQSKQQSAQ